MEQERGSTLTRLPIFERRRCRCGEPRTALWRKGWKGCGKTRGQCGANGSIVSSPETASTSRISLPPAATGCLQSRMVRRGSTVRVRQRALQRPRKSGPSSCHQLAVRPTCSVMEPVLEPSDIRRPDFVASADNMPLNFDPCWASVCLGGALSLAGVKSDVPHASP
jgi:hypothetical protein